MVTSKSFSRTVLLVFLSVLVASAAVSARRIDCTRFVFAPRCRGVAAKRGGNSLSVEDPTDLEDTFTDSLTSEASKDEESEKLLRILMDLSRALRRPSATHSTIHGMSRKPPSSIYAAMEGANNFQNAGNAQNGSIVSESSEEFAEYKLGLFALVIFLPLSWIMFLCGGMGSLIIILFTLKQVKEYKGHDLFFLNMALADCIIMGYCWLFFCLDLSLGYAPVLNHTHCILNGITLVVASEVYVASLIGLTFIRYVQVCYSRVYHKYFSLRYTALAVLMLWVLGIVAAISAYIASTDNYTYDRLARLCTLSMDNDSVINTMFRTFFFTAPIVLINSFNCGIYKFCKKASQTVAVNYRASRIGSVDIHTVESEVKTMQSWKTFDDRFSKSKKYISSLPTISTSEVGEVSEVSEVSDVSDVSEEYVAVTEKESSVSSCSASFNPLTERNSDSVSLSAGTVNHPKCSVYLKSSSVDLHSEANLQQKQHKLSLKSARSRSAIAKNTSFENISTYEDQNTGIENVKLQGNVPEAKKKRKVSKKYDAKESNEKNDFSIAETALRAGDGSQCKEDEIISEPSRQSEDDSQQKTGLLESEDNEMASEQENSVQPHLLLQRSLSISRFAHPLMRRTSYESRQTKARKSVTIADENDTILLTPKRVSSSRLDGFQHSSHSAICQELCMERLKLREDAVLRSLMLVSFTVVMAFLPYGVVFVISRFITLTTDIRIGVNILLFLNNTSNWFVYGIMNRSLRLKYGPMLSSSFSSAALSLRRTSV